MGRKKNKTQTTTSTQALPKWAEGYYKDYGRDVQGAARRGDLAQTAGFTADQQRAQQLARDAAGGQQQVANQTAGAHSDALSGTGLFGQQDLSGARADFLAQAREQGGEAAAGIGAGAAGRGTLGGARTAAAQEKARESARLGAADKFLGLQQQDLSARRGASQSAIGQTGGVQAAGTAAADTLAKSGAAQQQQQQKEADSAFTALKRQGQLLGTATAGQGTTTQTSPQQGGK